MASILRIRYVKYVYLISRKNAIAMEHFLTSFTHMEVDNGRKWKLYFPVPKGMKNKQTTSEKQNKKLQRNSLSRPQNSFK